jgi:hypothetical protein
LEQVVENTTGQPSRYYLIRENSVAKKRRGNSLQGCSITLDENFRRGTFVDDLSALGDLFASDDFVLKDHFASDASDLNELA